VLRRSCCRRWARSERRVAPRRRVPDRFIPARHRLPHRTIHTDRPRLLSSRARRGQVLYRSHPPPRRSMCSGRLRRRLAALNWVCGLPSPRVFNFVDLISLFIYSDIVLDGHLYDTILYDSTIISRTLFTIHQDIKLTIPLVDSDSRIASQLIPPSVGRHAP